MTVIFEPNVEAAIIKAASAFVYDYLNQPEGTEFNKEDHDTYMAARSLLMDKFVALRSLSWRNVYT